MTDKKSRSWTVASPCQWVRAGARSGPFATRAERFGKQRRRQKLVSRLADSEQRLTGGRVSVVAGGKKLLHKRHNLEEAGLALEDWRRQWEARRMFIFADGEAGKAWGNETIRVAPHGKDEWSVTIEPVYMFV